MAQTNPIYVVLMYWCKIWLATTIATVSITFFFKRNINGFLFVLPMEWHKIVFLFSSMLVGISFNTAGGHWDDSLNTLLHLFGDSELLSNSPNLAQEHKKNRPKPPADVTQASLRYRIWSFPDTRNSLKMT